MDDDGSQHAMKANDYGIQPDFDVMEEEDKEVCPSYASGLAADVEQSADADVGKEFEEQIAKMKAELEKMTPNMKAIDR